MTAIPSSGSRSSRLATGSCTSVVVAVPSPGQTSTRVTVPSCVRPKLSATVPRTRTTSPARPPRPRRRRCPRTSSDRRRARASSSCTKKPPRPPVPLKSPTTTPSMIALLADAVADRAGALDGVDRRVEVVTARAERDRRRRARVVGARRDAPQAGSPRRCWSVSAPQRERPSPTAPVSSTPGAGALGVRRAGVALVAEGVDERRPVAQPDRVGRAVLRPVGVGRDVQVAVRRVRRVRADDVEVARREVHGRQLDRPVDRGTAAVAVDEHDGVRVQVDGARADVLQLEELGGVGRSAGRSRPR